MYTRGEINTAVRQKKEFAGRNRHLFFVLAANDKFFALERLMRCAKWKWEIRVAACEILREMPALSHWPDRSQAFDWDKSELGKWIEDHVDSDVAYVYEFGKALKAIVFDSETKLWRGNPEWTEKVGTEQREQKAARFTQWRENNPRPSKTSSP